MTRVGDLLAASGLSLPEAPAALGAYVPATRAGRLVFTAGQLPLEGGSLAASGHVDGQVDVESAGQCARIAVLNALAAASTVCDLDDVERVVRLTCYVASSPGFTGQPAVADAASEVLGVAFAEAAPHARIAVGVSELPRGAPVEIDLVLHISG